MFIRLPKVFIDGDYYQLLFLSICFVFIIMITMITVFIIIIVVAIIIIIQGKDDTKLNKEIRG